MQTLNTYIQPAIAADPTAAFPAAEAGTFVIEHGYGGGYK